MSKIFLGKKSHNQHLTFEKTAALFEKQGVDFNKAQKRNLGLIGEDGTYTNLAFLLSEQCTHVIYLAVFEGSKKFIIKDRREFSGSLLSQFEQAYNFIDRYNRTRSEFKGLYRIDLRDYLPEVIREVLHNAIIYRDYSINAATLIHLFDDRIEFISIGRVKKGISPDDINQGVSSLPNQRLVHIFYHLGLIEEYSSSIFNENQDCSEFSIKPKIEISDNAFKITVLNANHTRENLRHAIY